jgi:hypothetical protein
MYGEKEMSDSSFNRIARRIKNVRKSYENPAEQVKEAVSDREKGVLETLFFGAGITARRARRLFKE